jgi:hypothetical protein
MMSEFFDLPKIILCLNDLITGIRNAHKIYHSESLIKFGMLDLEKVKYL